MTTPIYLVAKENIEMVWPVAKELVDKSLMHTDRRMESYDALRMILEDEMQLWVGFKDEELFSAFLTQVQHYPRHRTLQIVTYATTTGHGADFPTCIDTFMDFGRMNGCISLEAWCRKGLVRALPDWDHLYSVISKPIEPKKQRTKKQRRR